MAEMIRSRQGETIDAAIWRARGLGPADLPGILATNPGLADVGTILPTGTTIVVPPASSAPAVAPRDIVQLWD